MNQNTITLGIGVMGITVGMSILFISDDTIIRLAGGIIAFLGLIMCSWSYSRALNDDRKELNRQRQEKDVSKEMVSEFKEMNENISELIEEIRQDRNERK